MRAEPVTQFDDRLRVLIDDLRDTMYAHASIGLSAPQIGVSRQVLVIDPSGDQSDPRVFVNPEIIAATAPGIVEESCLSVPGIVINVLRRTRIRVRSRSADGAAVECDLDGMYAVCLQHEMDHLEGKLLVDRMNLIQKFRARSALSKLRAAAGPQKGRSAA